MDYQQEILERIKSDDNYLMYVADLLLQYNSNVNHGISFKRDGKTYPFKPLWKGHAQFIGGICKWWNDKHYLTPKQHDTVVKTIEKYMDRVETVFEILSNEVDNTTGSDTPIFGLNEFDAKCPSCGSRDFKIPNPIMDMTYKCTSCGFVATYVQDDEDDEDGNQPDEGWGTVFVPHPPTKLDPGDQTSEGSFSNNEVWYPAETSVKPDLTKSGGFDMKDIDKWMDIIKSTYDTQGLTHPLYGDSYTKAAHKMITDLLGDENFKVLNTAKKEDENDNNPF